MLFLVAQFFIIQSQYETYQNNQMFLTQGKEAVIDNVFVRTTQGIRHGTTDVFFDYENVDLGKVTRGYDHEVFDVTKLQNADKSSNIKVLYITEKESEFAQTKLYDNVTMQLKPRYIITQLLFLPMMIGLGIFIIALAMWWKEEKVDWFIFKAFWLVFIGENKPLSEEAKAWIKVAEQYEKEDKLK